MSSVILGSLAYEHVTKTKAGLRVIVLLCCGCQWDIGFSVILGRNPEFQAKPIVYYHFQMMLDAMSLFFFLPLLWFSGLWSHLDTLGPI